MPRSTLPPTAPPWFARVGFSASPFGNHPPRGPAAVRDIGLLLFLMMAVVSGCAAAKYDPFRIEKGQFRQRVRTIALTPVHLPSDIPEGDALSLKFESWIAGRLEQYGYATVPSVHTKEVF